MKQFLIITMATFFLLSTNKVNAQEEKDYNTKLDLNHYFGIAAGFTTGYGLSYKYWPNQLGVQFAFAPYTTDYQTIISFGTTFLLELAKHKSAKVFLYQGNHYFYNYYDYQSGSASDNLDAFFNNGLGFGTEFVISERMFLSLMAGYAFYRNLDNLSVTAEFSLMYGF